MTIHRRPNEDIDHMIRRFRRKVEKSGIIEDYMKHTVYMSKGEKKRARIKSNARWR